MRTKSMLLFWWLEIRSGKAFVFYLRLYASLVYPIWSFCLFAVFALGYGFPSSQLFKLES